jgi:hypothetical protein
MLDAEAVQYAIHRDFSPSSYDGPRGRRVPKG